MSTILTLQDIGRAEDLYRKGHWRGDTLYSLLRHIAETAPDRFVLRDTNSRLTSRAALARVDALACDLHAAGLSPGDRVSVWLPSRIESVLILLACSRMGYVCNPSLHRDYTCHEVVDLLQRAGTAALFAQPGYGADGNRHDIFDRLGDLPRLRKSVAVESLQGGSPDREDYLASNVGIPCDALPMPATSPDRIVYLAFTSGTTGRPKGVMHTDNTILANAREIVADWNFDRDTVVYSFSPMSHNIGTVGFAVTLVCGGEFVVHTPLDAPRMFDRLVETGATYFLGVPTHAIDLLSEVCRRGATTLGSVRACQLGGSAVPPIVVRDLMALGVTTQNAFGMTENHSFLYTRPDDTPETIATTCGRPCSGMETALWSEQDSDRRVTDGEVGELGIRGASLMLGYFDDQTASEAAFNREGWFMSGDLARRDAEGNIQIVGRKKDLIIRGGHNIYPSKIEDLTMRHAAVAKAAAFPIADDRLGERVCLAVIAKQRGAVSGAVLLEHLASEGLSKYDMPEYFLDMESFPLTASGKVLKRGLVQMVVSGVLKPEQVRHAGTAKPEAG